MLSKTMQPGEAKTRNRRLFPNINKLARWRAHMAGLLAACLCLAPLPTLAAPVTDQASYEAAIGTAGDGAPNLSQDINFSNPIASAVDAAHINLIFNSDAARTLSGWSGGDDSGSGRLLSCNPGMIYSITFNNTGLLRFGEFATQGAADTDNRGLGGAIYSRNLTLAGSGSYAFVENAALGGNSASAAANSSGHGGVIRVIGYLNLTGNGNYTFADNLAKGGNASGSGANAASSGLGGAILSQNSANFSGAGGYTFSDNIAQGGNAGGATSLTRLSGLGGAVFTVGAMDFAGGGAYQFSGNQAIGGDAVGSNSQTDASGQGGALYAGLGLSFSGAGNYTFDGNTSQGGSASGSGANAGGSGRGGAMYSAADIDFSGGGAYNFTGNQATGGNSDGTAGANSAINSGRGGALHATGAVTFAGSGNYTFDGNIAQGGDASNNGATSNSGRGGAIFVDGDLIFTGSGAYTFSNNKALTGTASSGGDVADSGWGGAAYTSNDLNFGGDGTYIFSNNQASRDGGAIYLDANLTGGIKNATFSGNQAGSAGGAVFIKNGGLSGGITDSRFENNIAATAQGGALSVGGDLTGGISNSQFIGNRADDWSGGAIIIENGGLSGGISNSTFSGNSARFAGGALVAKSLSGGIINSTFSGNQAQNGGAMYVWGGLSGSLSGSSFSGNQAQSGGAMYMWGAMDMSGAGVSFTNNQALYKPWNVSFNGIGGAILHDAYGGASLRLSAEDGAPFTFSGNSHSPNGAAVTPNSIYFSNLGQNTDPDESLSVTFNVASGGALNMLDPLASQPDDFRSAGADPGPASIHSNLALSIDKTGPGTWALAGVNDMQSATNWQVSEGSLHLVADSNKAPAHISLSNTSNKMAVADPASFTLKSGASLLVEPTTSAHQISGQKIVLESGSQVGLAGFQYGPLMNQGQHTALTLNAASVSNQSNVPQTSGSITIGANDYYYDNLAWDDNDLNFNVTASKPNPQTSGKEAITGGSHIGFNTVNNSINAFSYHTKSLFGNWANLPATTDYSQGALQYAQAATGVASDSGNLAAGENNGKYLNQLWVTPGYVNVNQSGGGDNVGYNLQTPGFAFGYDRQLGEQAFVGAGINVSWPDYTGGGTDITAQDITMALYGGVKLPYALELDGHAGLGFTSYDQDRQVQGERYSNNYNGQNFFVGLGLGRPFELGNGFSVRPGVGYDFIHLSTDGFDEGSGALALKSDDYTQDIHRVKAGVDVSWQHQPTGFKASGEVYYLGAYGDREASASAHFVNDPINGFTMIGNGLDENNLGLGLNVSLPVSERWELGAGYNVLLGSDTVSQQGTLNAKFKF